MQFFIKNSPLFPILLAAIILQACATSGNRVEMTPSNARTHMQADINVSDLLALAKKITNKMLHDKKIQNWAQMQPKIIVGSVRNDTDDPTLDVTEMSDRIRELIFNAQRAKIVDPRAADFDYIIKSSISSQRTFGREGQEDVIYTIKFRVLNFDGEWIGSWSDNLRLTKGARPLF
ncbi:MAG: hypothetical protein HQL71_15115 [Magnetococcales bacterium]|nr:hypothetical protein [Magnetococcales bacterium]